MIDIFKTIASDRGYYNKITDDAYGTETARYVSGHYIRLLEYNKNTIMVFDSKIGKKEVFSNAGKSFSL